MANELTALLTRALDQTGRLIAGIRAEQETLPTPCRSWDVRALVEHVVDEVSHFARVTVGEGRKHTETDLGDDWVGAFRTAADALLAAWARPEALDRPEYPPYGPVSPSWLMGAQITEMTVHAWDIWQATGQPTELDAELGRYALDWSKENIKPEYRGDETDGGQIGHEVKVPAEAPLYDRLAAFGGRDPQWKGQEA